VESRCRVRRSYAYVSVRIDDDDIRTTSDVGKEGYVRTYGSGANLKNVGRKDILGREGVRDKDVSGDVKSRCRVRRSYAYVSVRIDDDDIRTTSDVGKEGYV